MSSFPNVVTTGHDADGNAVFVDSPEFKSFNPHVGLLYRSFTDGAVDLNGDADLKALAGHDPKSDGLFPKEGSGILVAEWPPGTNSSSRMHRTLTVDIGYVMEGQVECHLDSGEKRTISKGEILMQRGTNHYWVNPSATETAKIVFFMIPSKPVDGVKNVEATVSA